MPWNSTYQWCIYGLVSYKDGKNAIEKQELISKINNHINPIPTDGLMPKNSRQVFNAWVTLGMKKN